MRKLTILFLCLFFCCCNPQPKIVSVKLQSEELEVIKETFPAAICCYLQQMQHKGFQSYNQESREQETKRFGNWADSIYRNLPEKLIWYTTDTLYNVASIFPEMKYYNNPRMKFDTTFAKLEKELFTIQYQNQAINLNSLIIGNYAFKSTNSFKKLNIVPNRYVVFSRVAFNSNYTKACYYISQSFPKKHWANGEMIFVEKKQGKWFVLYRKLYWIT